MKHLTKPNYVIAYLSLHDGELKQEAVRAATTLSALCNYLGIDESIYTTEKAVYEYCANCDCWISILEI